MQVPRSRSLHPGFAHSPISRKLAKSPIPCRILGYGVRKEPRPVWIFAAILAIFVYGMTAAMLGTILPDLSERFRLTPKQNGTIAFCQAIGLILASIAV